MENTLFGIENFDGYAVIGILLFFGLMETLAGYLHRSQRKLGDWIQEAGSFFLLSLLIKPGIVLLVLSLGHWLLPQWQHSLSGWSMWVLLPAYLLIDDLLQYWYHRSAHEYPWLWKLHRPHHQAEEMGFFVSYRNAALYYVLMPNIWWVALITFLGGAKAVAIGLILKQLVIISSHSRLRWDAPLYQSRWLRPLVRLLERIIITPAFHQAHHGKSMLDGISDPNGNYGNMFSFWDQLFGTATYTHQFPTELGLPNDPKDKWTASMFYPLVTSNKPQSEIARGFRKRRTASREPAVVELEQGRKYLWCRCGMSRSQPFCDGSHQGSKFKPLLFEAPKSGPVRLCNCKLTKQAPFCDFSHLKAGEGTASRDTKGSKRETKAYRSKT
ncbi:MAG: hypothetical protein D6730_13480 [Bacteroidetes bacterium]|nr:MAG: hypothetical protein D6730_13480 [Bacteroidota bacterium]